MLEILTSPSQVPHKGWLKFVKTSRARAKIKHWFKVEEQKRALEIGRRLLEREFRRHNLPIAQTLKSDQLVTISKEFGVDSTDEMIRMVGYGRLATGQIFERLQSGAQTTEQSLLSKLPTINRKVPRKEEEKSVRVKGGRDVLMQLSKCCNPIPGDQIMGYITRGRGLSIHSVKCPNLQAFDWDKNRLVEVDWDSDIDGTQPVKVFSIDGG